ncbi:MAG: hypothetical protein AB7O79_13330 [Xanthobacteraceae bacterium]
MALVTLSDEPSEADPILVDAIEKLRLTGLSDEIIAHSLISAGLAHMAGHLCSAHVLEQLTFLSGFIQERIEDTRQEMN